jgi:hypothetical protein
MYAGTYAVDIYLISLLYVVFWEVCSVYDDSLNSMLEVCWEVPYAVYMVIA